MSAGRQAGFTLVELLVAIAILGLLLTAAFGSLRLGSRSWEEGITRADESHEFRRSADFLRRQFAHLTPLSRQDGQERRIAFSGQRSAVQFVAPAPDAASGAGLQVLTLAVDRRSGDATVWLEVAPLDPGDDAWFDETPARRVLLADDLEDAEISYFGAPYQDDDRAWRREWRADAMRFPESVRLSTTVHDDARWPPELHFQIRAGQSL